MFVPTGISSIESCKMHHSENMQMNENDNIVYSRDVVEFTHVAVRYCATLEQLQGCSRRQLTDSMLTLLPMLYLKAQTLPEVEANGSFLPPDKVTESDYDYIRTSVYALFGADDEFLDVVYEEAMQTDETQWRSLSECLADIYQPLRNYLAVYQDGIEDCMQDALWQVRDAFELYWGHCAVNALRRLHQIKYVAKDTTEDTGYDEDDF